MIMKLVLIIIKKIKIKIKMNIIPLNFVTIFK